MENKKRMSINLIASLIAFGTNMFIGFFITPHISQKLGDGAYSFIGIANNFVSYANILTVALNSMASRYIALEFHKENYKKANTFFNSVVICNMVMALAFAFVSVYMVSNIEHLLVVSENLVLDVKITFAIVFFNFILSLVTSVYSIAPFVKNRIDLSSMRTIGGNLVRLCVLIPLFVFLPAKIYYIGIAAMANTIFLAITNLALSRKLMPEIQFDIKSFNWSAVLLLLSSGIWNSVNQLSTVLLNGLDLIIANLFVSEAESGLLSISKTIPTNVISLLATLGGVFTPIFIKLYAQGKIEELVKQTKFSMKILTVLMTVPLAGFIVFGREFYSLWLWYKPEEEIIKIQILSVLTLAPNIFSSYIYTLYSINTVTNKLKVPVLLTLILSIISTCIVFILLKYTDLGVYAIAGVSSIILILRILIFVPIYAAYNLKVKWHTFYPPLIKGIMNCCVLSVLFLIINNMMKISTWLEFALIVGIAGAIGYIISFIMVFDKQEKNKLLLEIRRKICKS